MSVCTPAQTKHSSAGSVFMFGGSVDDQHEREREQIKWDVCVNVCSLLLHAGTEEQLRTNLQTAVHIHRRRKIENHFTLNLFNFVISYTTIQKLGVRFLKYFWKKSIMLPRLHLKSTVKSAILRNIIKMKNVSFSFHIYLKCNLFKWLQSWISSNHSSTSGVSNSF